MVWILALVCMGLAGLAGSRRGATCAAFSLLGLLAGLCLAGPLSPLAAHLLPVLGFEQPLWQLFVPGIIAFLGVVIIFKIAGNIVHQKLNLYFKYKKYKTDENLFLRWERLYNRLGFCVGVVNGALYFFILMLPVYVAGYFTTEAAAAGATARLLTSLRAQLHDSGLDRVVAAYDPIPASIYQATDVVELVMRNPALTTRLEHYPPLLAFSRQKEIQDILSDKGLQAMLQHGASVSDLLEQPKIQALMTNTAVSAQIRSLLDGDLTDLQEYLNTGKSPKYDSEKILGLWDIDVRATWDDLRKRHPEYTRKDIADLNTNFVPAISNYSLLATPDHHILMGNPNVDWTRSKVHGDALPAEGTWKKTDTGYEFTFPNKTPDTVTVTLGDGTLEVPWDRWILVFNKEM